MTDEDMWRVMLGGRIRAARLKRFRTVDKARVAAEVARGTWDKAERGEPIKDFSLAAIERALDWPEGYAASILAGEPSKKGTQVLIRELVAPATAPGIGFDAYLEGLEDRIGELEDRVIRLEGGDGNVSTASTSAADEMSAAPVELPSAAKTGDIEEPGEDSI